MVEGSHKDEIDDVVVVNVSGEHPTLVWELAYDLEYVNSPYIYDM